MVRDMVGQVLKEGDRVAFPLGYAQTAVGHVQKISELLGADPNAPQHILVTFTLAMQVVPGAQVVPAITKMAPEVPAIAGGERDE